MRRPYRLALTGSIGMGKSTTATLLAGEGVPVWDADAAVHRIYGPGGGGAEALKAIAPRAVADDSVDRQRLREAVVADVALLSHIEAAIHPLVVADRQGFLARHEEEPLVVCDVPLLFETGGESAFDGVLVVTAPPEVQRDRVLARPGMDEAAFARLLARQMPDAAKRKRADFEIRTDRGLEAALADVRALVAKLRNQRKHA